MEGSENVTLYNNIIIIILYSGQKAGFFVCFSLHISINTLILKKSLYIIIERSITLTVLVQDYRNNNYDFYYLQ